MALLSIIDLETRLREFPYYLPIAKPPRIAFGTCKERFTDKAIGKVVKRQKILNRFSAKPCERCCSSLQKNYPSKRGYGGLVSQVKRFQEPPTSTCQPPGYYDVEQKQSSSKFSYPFNTHTRITTSLPKFSTPAPSDYACVKKRPQLPVNMAFGTQRLIIPAVTVLCGIENKSQCFKCQRRPEGDYFRNFELRLDLCRQCMNEELTLLRNCNTDIIKRVRKLKELGKYKPTRWCDFHHIHKGSKLLVKKYPLHVLRKKITTENYCHAFDKMQKWYLQY